MAKVKLQIQIQNPCNEDWHAMPVLGNGRYCAICNKCVIDFTTKTDREVIEIFSRTEERLCGQFREDQLNRNMILPQQARISGWRLFALTFGALFATDFTQAQTTKPKQLATKHYTSAKPVQQKNKFLIISGSVKSKTGEPLQETFIGLKNKPGILAFTDSSGNFKFKLPQSWIRNSRNKRVILTFSRVGFYVFEQPVSTLKNHSFAIKLDALPEKSKKEETIVNIQVFAPEPVKTYGGPVIQIYREPILKSEDNYYRMKHDLKD